jgi:hypothetical protein
VDDGEARFPLLLRRLPPQPPQSGHVDESGRGHEGEASRVRLGVRASRRQGVMAVVDEVLIRMHAHPYLSTHARLAGVKVDRYYPDTFMRSIHSPAQHACILSEGRQSQGVRVTDHVAAHAISPVLLLSFRTTTTGSGRLPSRSPLAGRWSGSGGRTGTRPLRPSAPASRTAPRRWLVE